MIAKQRIPLSFRRDKEFVLAVAVVLIGTGMSKILMVGFVFVNVVEIMRKISAIDRRRVSIERSASDTLKKMMTINFHAIVVDN